MAEYVGSESELPQDELIPAVTSSTDETDQNIAQARSGNNDQNLDKFSELTSLVFYHILSFLGVNDLARLCVVSARFQERCVSSPNIHFDVNFDEESCTSKCRGLRNLLEKLLHVQAEESGLLQMNLFRLHWHCHDCRDFSPTSVFHRWLKRAVVCSAQEIDIGFFPGQVGFVLPDCLRRASTTVLRLNLHDGLLNCQPKDDFSSIQILSLSSIRVPSRFDLGEWISGNFASLKTLKLDKIRLIEDLLITSLSLECLTISHCLIGSSVGHYTCNIDCTSLKSLLVHYCRFQSVNLGITCPSLKDLQITKSSNVSLVYSDISAQALCTLSIDMVFFAPWGGIFIIHPQSLQSLERVTLKLELHDGLHDDSDEIRAGFDMNNRSLWFFRGLNYTYVLEIDIGTIGILVLKEVKLVLYNLRNLEVTIDNLQELHATDIAMFISVIRSASADLRTLTIIYDECQSDRILLHVVESLESCVGKEIPATVEMALLKRPLTVARDEALACICSSCILSAV